MSLHSEQLLGVYKLSFLRDSACPHSHDLGMFEETSLIQKIQIIWSTGTRVSLYHLSPLFIKQNHLFSSGKKWGNEASGFLRKSDLGPNCSFASDCLCLSLPEPHFLYSQRWSFTHLMIPSLKQYYLGIRYLIVARDSLMSSHKHSLLSIIISTS